MTWRNLVHLRRNPELIVFATIQPIIFVLMFVYVFGGAIKVPGSVPTSTSSWPACGSSRSRSAR